MERLVPHVHDSVRDHRTGMQPEQIPMLQLLRDTMKAQTYDVFPHDAALIPDGKIPEVFSTAMERMHTSTNFLHEYEEAGMIEGMSNGDCCTFPDATLHWNVAAELDPSVLGEYEQDFDINLRSDRPNEIAILQHLSLTGRFPEPIETLLHERIHAIQDPDYKIVKVKFLHSQMGEYRARDLRMFRAPTEMIEAQAHRTANAPYHLVPAEKWIQDMLAFKEAGIAYTDISENKLRYATEAIDIMNALGMTIQEIGKVVIEPGKWHRKHKRYANVHDAIDTNLRRNNMTRADVPDLLTRHALELEIDQYCAQRIVREEIMANIEAPIPPQVEEEQSRIQVILGELRTIFSS